MAFQPGFNTRVLAHDTDVSGYLHDVLTHDAAGDLRTTTFGHQSVTRIGGVGDASLTAAGLFDGGVATVGGSDDVLTRLLGASQPWSVGFMDFALGNPVKLIGALETHYGPKGKYDGVEEFDVAVAGDGGLDPGLSLHAVVAETATANGTAVDNAVLTSNGGIGHLHVVAAAGTTPTLAVKIQHSTDNITFADLITFATASAIASGRIAVAAGTTVNRYVRAIWTIGGTGGPTFTFAVAFARR